MLVLLIVATALAAPCPDTLQAIEDAGLAVREKDFERLEELLITAQRGLVCGPILENRSLRATFWLAQAVDLDNRGDRATADKALVAAWRADPDVSIADLPPHLRVRYAKVIERPMEDASFRLVPAPDPNAVIYVDGQPFQQRAVDAALAHDASIAARAGLHVMQLAENPIALTAVAARVYELAPSQLTEFNIYEEVLLGREISPLKIGTDFDRASGGCAGRR